MNKFPEDFKRSNERIIEKENYSGQYVLTILLFLGMAILHILQLNLNIAIIEMTSNKTVTQDNQTITNPPEFAWDSRTIGFATSSIFYGYLLSPLSGYATEKLGGVRLCGIGIFAAAVVTFLTPISLYLNFYLFNICRMLEGVTEALTYASINDIWYQWATNDDRSKFSSIICSGIYVGAIISHPICGYLADQFGWPFAFYVTGTIAIIWYILWVSLTSNEPPPSIIPSNKLKIHHPWKQILTSKSVWVLSLAKFTYGWGYNLISICLPLYVKHSLGLNTSQTGFLSAIPNIFTIVVIPLSAYLIDLFINKHWLTVTQTHKLFQVTSLMVASVSIISILFTTSFTIIMIHLTVFRIFLCVSSVVVQVMPLYIAPMYSSGIAGISATCTTLANLLVPMLVGFMVTNNNPAEWKFIFTSTAAVMITGALIFQLFSSSELQPWAKTL